MVAAQGQAKWAKVAKKSFTYDVTHKKQHSPSKKIFYRVQTRRLPHLFRLLPVCRACRTREIPAQSHVRLGGFFSENPQTLADAKELSKIDTIINIMYIYIIDISI